MKIDEIKNLDVKELTEMLANEGINKNRLDGAISSTYLPAKGVFTHFTVEGEAKKDEDGNFVKDENGNFVDSFRHFNKEPHNYTWWSYRAGARGNNKGWRIDYNFITQSLQPFLKRSIILKDVVHSDHCPILIEV